MAITAAKQNSDIGKISATISEVCNHLIEVLRSMMQQLHPLVLSELGLKAALEDMVEHWSERNPNLDLQISCDDAVDDWDKNISRQIFRVIQECLTNIVRHADASSVTITLKWLESDKMLELIVNDDGCGCDLDNLNRGFGLRGMKERIKSLDGEFVLHSLPGQGMSVTARIPLS